MTTTDRITLEYGHPNRLAWVTRHRRALILLAILVLIGSTIAYYGDRLQRRASWLYWSHRCATFQMPANTKIYVSNPEDMQRLAGNPDYVRTQFVFEALLYRPRAWEQLLRLDSRANPIVGWTLTSPIAFLGSMNRPDGTSRLVVLEGCAPTFDEVYSLKVLVLPHPGLFDPIPQQTPAWKACKLPNSPATAYIGAAQLDPTDQNHLVMKVHSNVGTHTLDAYLQSDDSLKLKLDPTVQTHNEN